MNHRGATLIRDQFRAGLVRPTAGLAPGDPVELRPGEVPVFWACGVTPQAAVMASQVPYAITHAPGYMFVTDVPDTRYAV